MTRAEPATLSDGSLLLSVDDERDWSSYVLARESGGRWEQLGHVAAWQELI